MKTYVEINNTPSDHDKYIVARHDKDTRSFWFWGSYEDKDYEQECDDCISRKAVLELAAKGNLVSNSNYESVCKAINGLPSASIRNQRWIPVSERLPEKEGRYLCTVGSNYRNPREMYYAPQEWAKESDNATWRSTDGSYVYDWFVEAWIPLPEPYKEVKADASNE